MMVLYVVKNHHWHDVSCSTNFKPKLPIRYVIVANFTVMVAQLHF